MVDTPEKIWATFEPHESGKGHLRTYATAQKTKGQEYLRADIAERQIAELRAENDKLLDDYEARVSMHHSVEKQYDLLHSAATDLIETVDGAYPGNAWTAEIKRTIRDIFDGLIL